MFIDIGFKRIHDPNFKGGLQVNQDYLIAFTRFSKGLFLDRVLKETLYTEIVGLELPKNHKFFEIFDKKIQQLFNAGIVDYYRDEFVQFTKPKRYKHLHNSKPKVLTLKILEAGFVVWLISLFMSFLAFVGEWTVRIKDFLVFEYILEKFYDKIIKH